MTKRMMEPNGDRGNFYHGKHTHEENEACAIGIVCKPVTKKVNQTQIMGKNLAWDHTHNVFHVRNSECGASKEFPCQPVEPDPQSIPNETQIGDSKVCALCAHEITSETCGSAFVGDLSLCHSGDHSCYDRWTVYGERPSEDGEADEVVYSPVSALAERLKAFREGAGLHYDDSDAAAELLLNFEKQLEELESTRSKSAERKVDVALKFLAREEKKSNWLETRVKELTEQLEFKETELKNEKAKTTIFSEEITRLRNKLYFFSPKAVEWMGETFPENAALTDTWNGAPVWQHRIEVLEADNKALSAAYDSLSEEFTALKTSSSFTEDYLRQRKGDLEKLADERGIELETLRDKIKELEESQGQEFNLYTAVWPDGTKAAVYSDELKTQLAYCKQRIKDLEQELAQSSREAKRWVIVSEESFGFPRWIVQDSQNPSNYFLVKSEDDTEVKERAEKLAALLNSEADNG